MSQGNTRWGLVAIGVALFGALLALEAWSEGATAADLVGDALELALTTAVVAVVISILEGRRSRTPGPFP